MPKKDPFEMPYMQKKLEKEESRKKAVELAQKDIDAKKEAMKKGHEKEFEDVLEERIAEAQGKEAKHAKKSPQEKTKRAEEEIERGAKLKKMRQELGITPMTEEEEWDKKIAEAKKRLEKKPKDIDDKFDFSDVDAEKRKKEEYLEVTPDQIIESIRLPEKELDKNFTKLEKDWFAKEPEEKKEILENNEETTELFYKNQMDRLHAQDPEKYPSGEEYLESSDTLEYFDQRKYQIELELENDPIIKKNNGGKGFNILKGRRWAQYNIARKLDPDDEERFKKLLASHKEFDKVYREMFKKHVKKFSEALSLISPRSKGLVAERGRHLELGPPKFW